MEIKRLCKLSASALALFGIAGALLSCSQINGSSESSASETSSESASSSETSSSNSESVAKGWSDEQKALMEEYCGEVLPYPEAYFKGDVVCEVVGEDDESSSYLQIRDGSFSFTLGSYYEDLAKADWDVITDYTGSALQSFSSGTTYVEATKISADKSVAYDLFYYHVVSYAKPGGEYVPGGNVIRIFRNLSATLDPNSSWDEDSKAIMESVLTFELPFMKLGEERLVQKSDINSLQIYDSYGKDLTTDYIELLKANGFATDEGMSQYYNCYALSKTLEDGAIVDVLLSYYAGNIISVSYTPNVKTYSSWDNEFIAEVEQKAGLTVPKFDIPSDAEYKTFKKGGDYYIYTTSLLDEKEFDYDDYILITLKDPKLSWDEKASFSIMYVLGDDGETVVGIMLVISLSEPTSTFVSSWPSEAVSDTVENVLSIKNITLPSLEDSSIPDTGKQLKYEVRGEEYYEQAYAYYCKDIAANPDSYFSGTPTEQEILGKADYLAREEMGITVSWIDDNFAGAKAYEDLLYKMGWYSYMNSDYHMVYEDPKGKIAVTIIEDTYEIGGIGTTDIVISSGSGNKHTAEFCFLEDNVNIAQGGNKALDLVKSMLPYDVTFTCSDTTGKITVDQDGFVTVAEDAEIGLKATITASIEIPNVGKKEVSCTVTVKKDLNYTPEKAIETVASLLKAKGYEATPANEDDLYYFTVSLGSATSESDAEKLVEEELIPEGFYQFDTNYPLWEDDWNENGVICSRAVYCVDNDDSTFTMLKYHVYTKDGNVILYVTAIC